MSTVNTEPTEVYKTSYFLKRFPLVLKTISVDFVVVWSKRVHFCTVTFLGISSKRPKQNWQGKSTFKEHSNTFEKYEYRRLDGWYDDDPLLY